MPFSPNPLILNFNLQSSIFNLLSEIFNLQSEISNPKSLILAGVEGAWPGKVA